MKTVFCLLLVSSLAGCASFSYVEPKSGPIATITVRTSAPHNNIGVVSYTGDIEAESEGDSIGILNSGVPGVPRSPELTVKISAKDNFRFSTKISSTVPDGSVLAPGVGLPTSSSLCKTHTEFKPRDGAKYIALHKDLPGGGCQMEVFEISQDGSRVAIPADNKEFCVDPKLDGAVFANSGKYRVCKYNKK